MDFDKERIKRDLRSYHTVRVAIMRNDVNADYCLKLFNYEMENDKRPVILDRLVHRISRLIRMEMLKLIQDVKDNTHEEVYTS